MTMFYLVVAVISLCGIWLMWEIAFRELFLDGFRQRLFEIRLALFTMAEDRKISFDNEAYRSIEALLNALIRYAHKMSFTGYIFSLWEIARAKRDDPDYVDFGQVLALKISRLPVAVQDDINAILSQTHRALGVFIVANSLLFKIVCVLYFLKVLRLSTAKEKLKDQMFVIEREAYLTAKNEAASMA
jgi:hypothetical protein